jgi:hypothetical protein
VFVLALTILGTLSAATVSFLVVETDLPPGSARPESSTRWEGGVMGVFFDAGHIVFNAPVMRLDRKPAEGADKVPPELKSEFDEAKAGGADYFVVVLLEYSKGIERPGNIQMKLFNAANGALLYEASWAGTPGISPREELLNIQNSAKELLARLKRKG